MNADIRLSVEFFDHPKTVKLQRRLGLEAVICLQRLWLWSAQNRPDGVLANMDSEDIEIAAKWEGQSGELIACLVDLRWIDESENGHCLHDWQDHNPWQAETEVRSGQSRLSRMAKVYPEAYKAFVNGGRSAVTEGEYRLIKENKGRLTIVERLLTDTTSPFHVPIPKPEEIRTPPKAPPKNQGADPQPEPVVEGRGEEGPVDISHSLNDAGSGIEFAELRELYDREGVEEAPMAGHVEFLSLCKKKQWPGLGRIAQSLVDFEQDHQWTKENGRYRPGLAKFLREQWWLKKPIQAKAREPTTSGISGVKTKGDLMAERVLQARQEQAENGYT